MKPRITMRKAVTDKALLGAELHKPSWAGWRVLLIAMAGEKLTDKERVIFKKFTGREHEPGSMVKEFAALVGRRSGKSYAMACFLVWVSALCAHPELVAGEAGLALCISRDQRVAKVILGYVNGIIDASPALRTQFVNRTADTIELKGRIFIEVRPCRHETLRGMTCIVIIADEIAHWFTSVDFSNPDVEVIGALRPSLLTTRGPLIMVSSVYARAGVLFDIYQSDYGPHGAPDILVAFGTSRDLHPDLPQDWIDREIARDPVRNKAEYLSEFRSDVAGFIDPEIVRECVGDYCELPFDPACVYVVFVDAASGVDGGDSYAICVAHRAGDKIIIDAIREIQAPFNPTTVIDEIAIPLCKAYNVYQVIGDAYAGQFASQPFLNSGMFYELSKKHKSALYADPFLSLLNSRRLVLPKHDRAINQICSLERSVKRSGADEISHPTGGRDDCANAIAGAAFVAFDAFGMGGYNAFGGVNEPPQDGRTYHTQQLVGLLDMAVQSGAGSTDPRLDGTLFGGRQSPIFSIPYQSPFRRGF